jgi:hypothetical protein
MADAESPDGTYLTGCRESIGGTFKRGGREAWNEGDKWQGRRLPHMVDKRRRIKLKLLG